MRSKDRESVRGRHCAPDRRGSGGREQRRRAIAPAGARAEVLEPRLLLSQGTPAAQRLADAAAVRVILSRPVREATAAQLAQVARLGLAPVDWKDKRVFAEKDHWVVSIDTGRGKLNKQVKAAQAKVGGLLKIERHLGKQDLFLATAPAGTSYDKLLASLKKVSGFTFAEPNAVVGVGATPNDPEFGKQWSLNNTGQTGGTADADVDAPEAWNTTVGSPGVTVAVVDTGVDYTHPDLAPNVWTNKLETPNDGIDNDGNGYVDDVYGWDFYNADNDPFDDNGHGTHVAGIIGAAGDNKVGIVGVSQRARVMAIKAFGADGFGLTADCVNAINYATALKLRGENVRVINNSWGGGGYSQAMRDAIAASSAADMLFVAAAGNYGADTDSAPFYPASYDVSNVIAVAATDADDRLAVFSDYGKTSVDLAAPGVDVYSTVAGGGYDYKSGTSMAAAHVAGAAALLWGYAPDVSGTAVRQAILSTVDPIAGLTDQVATNGRLNVQKAFGGLGMLVTGSTPAAGAVISTTNLSQWVVTFSSPINSATLSASDLKVNGKSASFASVTGPQQASFTFSTAPVTTAGPQTISMAAGAVASSGSGLPLLAWSSTFYYDPIPLTVQSTTPANGSAASVPLTTLRVKFNEAIDFSSVSAADLVPSQGSVTGVISVDASTVQFNLSGIVNEGTLTFSIPAGAVKDVAGNPSQAYNGSLTLDAGANPIPISFAAPDADGSLVYEATATGALSSSGDSDAFEVSVPAGQLLTLLVEPGAGTLTPSVALRTVAGATLATATAAGGGKTAFVASFAVPAAGKYRIVVTSASGSGSYTVRAVLNADVERESVGGASNATPSAAQDLGPAMVVPVASNAAGSPAARAGVRGRLTHFASEVDVYAVTLTAGQSFTATLRPAQGLGVGMSLLAPNGSTIPAPATYDPTRIVFQTPRVVVQTSGTYYVQLTTQGLNDVDYTLVVTRDAYAEGEPNDIVVVDGAPSIPAGSTVIGSIAHNTFSRLLAADSFTGRVLKSNWSTYTSDLARGRVRVEGTGADGDGLILSNLFGTVGGYTLNEATWTVNLTGAVSPVLTFAHASYNDEVHPFQPGNLTGHVNGDGILISDDGVRWHPIWTPPVVAPYVWTYVTLDLAAEAARYGMAFGANFRIKFQQYDNEPEVDDGRGFDDIRVYDRQLDTDAYVVSGNVGDELHLSAAAITAGDGTAGSNVVDPILSLYDATGNLLAYDHRGGADGKSAELFAVLPYTGSYRVVVESADSAPGEYVLRTTVAGAGGGGAAPAPDLLAASDGGGNRADDVTNFDNATLARALQFAVHGVAAGALVKLYADGALIGQATALVGGDFVVASDGATAIADGLHQFTFTQTPAGGNPVESAPSRALAVLIDTTPPGTIAAPTLRTTSDSGPSKTDGITQDQTPTLVIPALPPGTFFQVFRDGVAEPGGLISTATYTPAELADGTYAFTLALADVAGNLGPQSAPLRVTVDTTAPDAPPAPVLDAASDTGRSASDRLTKDTTPTITFDGSAYFAVRIDGVDVTTGPFAGSYTAKALPDGVHVFTVAAVDAAGNASDFGPGLAVTIDTAAPATSLAGDPDPTFGTAGAVVDDISSAIEHGAAVAVQPDGKILFAGNYWNGAAQAVFVNRYLASGAPDPSFGTNGRVTFVVAGTNDNAVKSVTVQPDGKILVAGDANTNLAGGIIIRDMFVARLTAAGVRDSGNFNANGSITLGSTQQNEYANAATLAPDGKIWVAGRWEYQAALGIATSDGFGYAAGGLNQGYRTVGIPSANSVAAPPHLWQFAVGPDNKMYALGASCFADDSSAYDLFVMRFNLDGTTDFSFAPSGYLRLATTGVNELPGGIAVRPDGKIVIGYGTGGRLAALRLLPGGALDPTFGVSGRTVVQGVTDGGGDYPSAMVVLADGRVALAGTHQGPASKTDFVVARLLTDGAVDGGFGSGGRRQLKVGAGNSGAAGLAAQPDANLLVAGDAYASTAAQTIGNPASALVRLSSTTSLFIDLNAASDSGTSNADNYTNDATPDLTLATAGPYNLYRDGVKVDAYATATAFSDVALPDGQHAYALSLVDDAGNDSAPFLLNVTVDTTADPVVPDLLALSDTGLSDTDNVTADNTPDFSFPGVDRYRLYRNGVELTFGYTSGLFTAPAQPDGAWNYTAQTVDLAGNVAPAGAALNVTIDTVAPAAPAAPDLDPASDTGISATDNVTSSETLGFLPLTTAGAPYVRLYRNGILLSPNYLPAGSAFVSGTGNVSGVYTFTAVAVDVAGNLSPASAALSVNVDTFAPGLSGQANSWDFAFDRTVPNYPLAANESLLVKGHVRLSDGKLVVAARLWNGATGIAKAALIHLLPDGAPDPTFGVNGLAVAAATASPYTSISTLVALPDGRIVGAGAYGTDVDNGPALMRFTATGELDPTFGAGGIARVAGTRGEALDLARQPDGKLVLAGYRYLNQKQDSVTARFTADGAPDATFGAGGAVVQSYSDTNDQLSALVLQPDGKIVVGGAFEFFNIDGLPPYATGLIRYNADGSLDATFGSGGLALRADAVYNLLSDATLLPDGSIVTAGQLMFGSLATRALLLMKFNPDGTLAASFGNVGVVKDVLPSTGGGYNPRADALVALPDGKLLVGGTIYGDDYNSVAVRYTAAGAHDTSLNGNGIMTLAQGRIAGLSLDPSNRLLTSGNFVLDDTTGAILAARYFVDAVPALDLTAASDNGVSQTDNLTSDATPDLAVVKSDLYYRVYDGGTLISSLWETADTFTPQTPLVDGTHVLTLRSVDAAGNVSLVNPSLTVRIDTQLGALDLVAASDTGASDTDNVTADATPTFDFPGARFKLYLDGQPATPDYVTGPLTLGALVDGTYAVTVDAIDDAGNMLTAAPAFTLVVDTTPPDAPAAPDLRASSDTGISATDDVTKDNTPTLDFAPLPHVRVYRGGVLLADLTDGAGTYTTPALPDGSQAFTLRAVDLAGNESAASPPLVVHVDTVGPDTTRPVIVSGSATGDGGEVVTNDDTPAVDVPGLYYFLSINGIQAGGGVQSGPHDVPHLDDGLHHLTALLFDAAGNQASSTELLVRVDTVAPKVPSAEFLRDGGPTRVRIAFDEDVARSLTAADLVVRNLTTGADVGGATLTYDAQANVATWTFAAGALPPGDYAATLFSDGVTDRAGNPVDGDGDGTSGGDREIRFFHLDGDVNLDRVVDFNDLVVLAQHYNTSAGMTWASGDFTGDGAVDFNDLVKLAQGYNTSVHVIAPAAAASAATTTSAAPAVTFAEAWAAAVTRAGAQAAVPPLSPATAARLRPEARPAVFSVRKIATAMNRRSELLA